MHAPAWAFVSLDLKPSLSAWGLISNSQSWRKMDGLKSKRSRHTGAVRLRIEALLDPSRTAFEIADAVGCQYCYVHTIAKANGVTLRTDPAKPHSQSGVWSAERIDRLKELWVDQGLSQAQIAAEMRLTRNAVIGKISRMGWTKGKARTKITKAYAPRKPKPAATTPGVSRPKAPKFAPDYVPPPPSEYDVARKPLQHLETSECKYPVGDPMEKSFGFCALDRIEGSPYCSVHHHLCYSGTPVAGRKVPANDEREKATA